MPTRQEWDGKFAAWAKPPGKTEQDKCDNAVRAIRAAIAASQALSAHTIKAVPQGSYRSGTNVRAESDVDVCVSCSDSIFFDLPPDTTPDQVGITVPATYGFAQYRTDVGTALTAHFGAPSVRAGSKAFNIHENTNRIEADAVPVFEYRNYQLDVPPVIGTAFLTAGTRIINYPEQHYSNGVAKNDATARRFKMITRVLKRLRYEMIDERIAAADSVQSFQIESMVWNVPNPLFGAPSLREDIIRVISHIYANTEDDQKCAGWKEVNGIKPLFGPGQPWSRVDVRPFLEHAWSFAELAE